ncbi:hypothetical protein [Aeromonas veronii]|uniref:hypothetical protein n=1 Tax=Aeromonas veronii TaxID=654 RepID=UPI002444E941|nr:hypothetical protein [Aeromonas veronii]
MGNNVVEKLTVNRNILIEIVVVAFLLGVCASISGSILFETLEKKYFLALLLFGGAFH